MADTGRHALNEAQLEEWVRGMLSDFPLPDPSEDRSLSRLLRDSDGLWLCVLLNKLDPSKCDVLEGDDDGDYSDEDAAESAANLKSNLNRFGDACKALGLPESEVCGRMACVALHIFFFFSFFFLLSLEFGAATLSRRYSPKQTLPRQEARSSARR